MESQNKKDKKSLEELTYEDLALPGVSYSTPAARIGNVELNVLDIIRAAVLSGNTLFIVGHSEKGKSFIARKIRDYWFGGKGNLIQGSSLDESTELFSQVFKKIDIKKATETIEKEKLEYPFMFVDEVASIPKALQSQFWPIGDGKIPHKGKEYYLGIPLENEKRYLCHIASTNTIWREEDGDYSNFGITKATASRYHLILDTRRKLRRKDKDILDIIMSKDDEVLHSENKEKKDITGKIIMAHKKIKELSENDSLEEKIASSYLFIGTGRCEKGERYEDNWQDRCLECNKFGSCPAKYVYGYEMMRQAKVLRRFANALYYIAYLKEGKEMNDVNKYDAVFEAAKFVIGGKYSTMNMLLKTEMNLPDYDFVEQAIGELKKEFDNVRPYIDLSIGIAKNYGEACTQFHKENRHVLPICKKFFEEIGKNKGMKGKNLEKFVNEIYKKFKSNLVIEPFNNNGYVNLSWFPKLIEEYVNENKKIKI